MANKNLVKRNEKLRFEPLNVEDLLIKAKRNDEIASDIRYGITSCPPALAEMDETARPNLGYRRNY